MSFLSFFSVCLCVFAANLVKNLFRSSCPVRHGQPEMLCGSQ